MAGLKRVIEATKARNKQERILRRANWKEHRGFWRDPTDNKEWLFDNAVQIQIGRNNLARFKY